MSNDSPEIELKDKLEIMALIVFLAVTVTASMTTYEFFQKQIKAKCWIETQQKACWED